MPIEILFNFPSPPFIKPPTVPIAPNSFKYVNHNNLTSSHCCYQFLKTKWILVDDNTEIFHVFELWIGMNELDHGILVVPKQQREWSEKFRPEQGFWPEFFRPISLQLNQHWNAMIKFIQMHLAKAKVAAIWKPYSIGTTLLIITTYTFDLCTKMFGHHQLLPKNLHVDL